MNNTAGGDYLFFYIKRGQLFEGRRLFQILLMSLEVVPEIFSFIFPLNQKIITSNKLNIGFLSFPTLNFGFLINFQHQFSESGLESSLISFAGSESTST